MEQRRHANLPLSEPINITLPVLNEKQAGYVRNYLTNLVVNAIHHETAILNEKANYLRLTPRSKNAKHEGLKTINECEISLNEIQRALDLAYTLINTENDQVDTAKGTS